MSDFCELYKYDKDLSIASPVIIDGSLINYVELVKREGGKTSIKETFVIDMDFIKNSLKINPTPSSMDIAFIVSKENKYSNGIKKMDRKYILADLKFNVTSVNNILTNISNKSIREKFSFSVEHIRSKDMNIRCHDTAYFVFNDKNFEQIRNRWTRRNLNFPKNVAVKQSDFEKVFICQTI